MRIIIIVTISLVLVGCKSPYDDLEKNYPAERKIEGKIIKPGALVITSLNHSRAFNFKSSPAITLSPNFIELNLKSMQHKNVQIPLLKISGCSKTCYSNSWLADIYINETKTIIGIPNANSVIEWCWESGIPLLTSKEKANWHHGKKFSTKNTKNHVSKKEYMALAKKSCHGY